MSVTRLYEDKWGRILLHQSLGICELQWWETTADIDDATFRSWAINFAEINIGLNTQYHLIDYRLYLGNEDVLDATWRDDGIRNKCHEVGIRKVANVLPANSKYSELILKPADQIDVKFHKAYFKDRQKAIAWLMAP